MTTRTTLSIGVLLIVAAGIGALVVTQVRAQNPPAWINQDATGPPNKQKLQAFGERFETSEALYEALKQAAGGGKPPTWQQMGEPAYDWSGIYTRTKGGVAVRSRSAADQRSGLRQADAGRSSRSSKPKPTCSRAPAASTIRSATAARRACRAGSPSRSCTSSSSRRTRRG